MEELFTETFWFEMAKLIVESLIVLLLWKTVRDYSEVGKLSRIQAKVRFRPWVGPCSGIQLLSVTPNKQHQFSITLKNFGESPALSVIARFTHKTEPITKDMLKSEKTSEFNLGPLLPNMDKRYFFFIDSDLIEKTKDGQTKIFIYINFIYEYEGGKDAYSSISFYDAASNSFLHKDMWIG